MNRPDRCEAIRHNGRRCTGAAAGAHDGVLLCLSHLRYSGGPRTIVAGPDDELVELWQVAVLAGVPLKRVQGMVRRGELPVVACGARDLRLLRAVDALTLFPRIRERLDARAEGPPE